MRLSAPPALVATALDDVLRVVQTRAGLDFTGYRRSTLARRLQHRLIAVRASDVEEYLHRLRTTETELDALVASLTIKLSRFYRNAAVFDALRGGLLADLRARFAPSPLASWSAGCGRGEEAYTLAMLLGDEPGHVWATDIDSLALVAARAARYPPEAFAELPASLTPFVERSDPQAWTVVPAVRRRVEFARDDLGAAEPSEPRFHLVLCRNVLIYFTPALQRRALRRLIESLRPGGLLCLGEAEWLGDATETMVRVDQKLRIFRRPPAGAR
jgi:chemotaxis methyl-accepting protein methylase